MVCEAGLGRIVLVVVNSLSALVGIALIAIGCVIKFFIGDILKSDIVKDITDTVFQLVVSNTPSPKSIDFGPFTETVGIIFIVIGTILLAISIVGCCAACCSFKPLLIAFCIVMGVMVVTQIVFYACVLPRKSQVHEKARDSLKDTLRSDYNRVHMNSFTISADIIFMAAECCGVEGPMDFANSSVLDFNFTMNGGVTVVKTPLIPPSCCQFQYLKTFQFNCAQDYNKGHSQGCYSKLQDLLEKWYPWLITTIVITLLVQVAEIGAAIMIYSDD